MPYAKILISQAKNAFNVLTEAIKISKESVQKLILYVKPSIKESVWHVTPVILW